MDLPGSHFSLVYFPSILTVILPYPLQVSDLIVAKSYNITMLANGPDYSMVSTVDEGIR